MPRNQDPIFRSFGTYNVSDNANIQVDLPRDLDYSCIVLRLSGTPTFTGSATAKSMAAPALFRNISLVANGSKQLFNGGGVLAALKNRIANQGKVDSYSFTATSGTDFNAEIFIDQSMIDGIVPKDSQLPSRGLSSLQLSISMAQLSDVMTGGSAYSFTGTVDVGLVNVREYLDSQKARFVPRVVQYLSEISVPAATSATDQQIILTTDCIQRQLIIYAMDSGVFADAITSIRIDRGNNTLFRMSADELKALNRRSQLDLDADFGASKPLVIDPSRFMGQGRAKMSDAWDMRSDSGPAEQLYMYITYTGASGRSITVGQNYFQNYARFVQ